MRQLILDTETTGLNPEQGHRIIEFAALEMIDRKLTGKSLQIYINPERKIDAEASRIHGITDSDVLDKPIFAEVVNQIIEYIKDAELIIHNAKFDLSFLDYQFRAHKLNNTHDYVVNVIDTLILARQKFPGSKNNLDALCDRFKIDRANRNFHGALIDCALLAEVYIALTREQISLLGDEKFNITNNKHVFKQLNNDEIKCKVLKPTATELTQHLKYLEELDKISKGKSVWYNLNKQSSAN